MTIQSGDSQAEEVRKQNSSLLKIVLGIGGAFVIVCGLVVLAILYKVGLPYSGPKTRIVLEPDYSLVSTVNPSDLETDVHVLNARARSLGYGAPFAVGENNQIIAQVPGSGDVEGLVGRTTTVGLLEFVDFGETPVTPGTTIATDFGSDYFPIVEGTKWHTVITNSDFKSANPIQDQVGQYQVSFTLTADGTKTLADYTTNNINRYLGIVLDKVVLSAPIVRSPITDGRGVISGNFTEEQAESLAVELNVAGPLPVPLIIKEVLPSDQ